MLDIYNEKWMNIHPNQHVSGSNENKIDWHTSAHTCSVQAKMLNDEGRTYETTNALNDAWANILPPKTYTPNHKHIHTHTNTSKSDSIDDAVLHTSPENSNPSPRGLIIRQTRGYPGTKPDEHEQAVIASSLHTKKLFCKHSVAHNTNRFLIQDCEDALQIISADSQASQKDAQLRAAFKSLDDLLDSHTSALGNRH